MNKSYINKEWKKLFSQFNIVDRIDKDGYFEISAQNIKNITSKEPRLMAKFDHHFDLPSIFKDNNLSILPISRNNYIIIPAKAYHKFEMCESPISNFSLPDYIQSLDSDNVYSEAIALNCAYASGIISDFLGEEGLVPTVSGRMGTGDFEFTIHNELKNRVYNINVNKSQIEIDAAYEGIKSVALFEAKRVLADDFLVRQLYYPYRVWRDRVFKPVRPVFLTFSNGIFKLYEYEFTNHEVYNSLKLVQQKSYSIENTTITLKDIEDILYSVEYVAEPQNSPFPQANDFERIINFCELLSTQRLTIPEITKQYDFDPRQAYYYEDAAEYLGLVEKAEDNKGYQLSQKGRATFACGYKERQLRIVACILEHKAFSDTLKAYLKSGKPPNVKDIVSIMQSSGLRRVNSTTTFKRRSSTVTGWINWILGLRNE